MATCEVCGNEYDKSFELIVAGVHHTFDSFECAIQAMAPICEHCKCRVIGTEWRLAVDSSAVPIALDPQRQPTSEIAQPSGKNSPSTATRIPLCLEDRLNRQPRRPPRHRRGRCQAAIDGREAFEISATVFDTRFGLSFRARSA